MSDKALKLFLETLHWGRNWSFLQTFAHLQEIETTRIGWVLPPEFESDVVFVSKLLVDAMCGTNTGEYIAALAAVIAD